MPAGDAQSVDGAQPVLPFDPVGNQFQHVDQPAGIDRAAAAQRQLARVAEYAQMGDQRVLLHAVRDLVDEAFHRERIAQVRHAAGGAARHGRIQRVPVAAIVGHQRGGQLVGLQFGRPQAAVGHVAMCQCGGTGHALRPAEQLAFAVDDHA